MKKDKLFCLRVYITFFYYNRDMSFYERVWLPPLGSRGVGGELHSLAREGVGGGNSDDCTLWYS